MLVLFLKIVILLEFGVMNLVIIFMVVDLLASLGLRKFSIFLGVIWKDRLFIVVNWLKDLVRLFIFIMIFFVYF